MEREAGAAATAVAIDVVESGSTRLACTDEGAVGNATLLLLLSLVVALIVDNKGCDALLSALSVKLLLLPLVSAVAVASLSMFPIWLVRRGGRGGEVHYY